MALSNYDILFICYGNVARSQMAESFYNKYSKSGRAMSAAADLNAGTKYKHPAQKIVTVMLEEGIDISKNSVKPVSKELVEATDKIVVLCDLNDCPRFVLESGKVIHMPVLDPGALDISFTRNIRDEVKRIVLSIL
jgi:protein-tyrosine-phosphatase